jgi:hypothetical protein
MSTLTFPEDISRISFRVWHERLGVLPPLRCISDEFSTSFFVDEPICFENGKAIYTVCVRARNLYVSWSSPLLSHEELVYIAREYLLSPHRWKVFPLRSKPVEPLAGGENRSGGSEWEWERLPSCAILEGLGKYPKGKELRKALDENACLSLEAVVNIKATKDGDLLIVDKEEGRPICLVVNI